MNVDDIAAAIASFSPTERQRLLRQVRIMGYEFDSEPVTDRGRLRVAPALGVKYTKKSREVRGRVEQRMASPDRSRHNGKYEPPISGKIVLGSPSPAPPVESAHVMPPLPGQAPEEPITLLFEGGSAGEPGRGHGSYTVQWPGDPQQRVRLQFGGDVTSEQAEYDALITGLQATLTRLQENQADPSGARLLIRANSMLVLHQIRGSRDCNEEQLQPRLMRVRELLAEFGSWKLRSNC